MNKTIRYLTNYLILAAFLLVAVGTSGCLGLSARINNEYKCSIPGESLPKTAEDYYNRAVDNTLGYDYKGIGDYNACTLGDINEALRLDPNHTKALLMRSYNYLYKKQYDLALVDANKVIQLEPANPNGYLRRSLIFDKQGLLDKALTDQTKGIELTPKDDDLLHYLYNQRGDKYVKKGEYELAVQDYTEAIRLKPNDRDYYFDRAETYRRLGKNELAEADEQKAGGMEPAQTSKRRPHTVWRGHMNDKAVNLVQPSYPPEAKAVIATSTVRVRVTVDEQGNVISASAVSGHDLLRPAAEAAARASKFSPAVTGGKAVRAEGLIKFKFPPEEDK